MTRLVGVLAAVALVALIGVPASAQTDAPAAPPDPRVGLKAGVRDADVAARGLELVVNVPKPQGFFDPKHPAGEPNPRMSEEDDDKADKPAKDAKAGKDKKGKKDVDADATFFSGL